jgi:protein CpxP
MNIPSRFLSRRRSLAAALCAGLMIAAPQLTAAPSPGPDHGPEAAADHPRDGHAGHGGQRHGGPFFGELKSLDLSDARRDSIRTAMKSQWQSRRSEHEALRTLQRRVDTATPDSSGYAGLVNQLADAQANAARDRVQKQAALKAEVFAMLTPAQQSKLAGQLKNLPEPPARAERSSWRQR